MRNNRESVYACTSSNFDGMIAVLGTQDSWVCKWQRIGTFVKGIYAISVSGKLPVSIVRDMKTRGIRYKSRDVSRT
jgi:transcription elongation factor SPT4